MPAPRCSNFARAEDLDPVGSAGSYEGIILLEIPLPWPREITEHHALASVAPALRSAGRRVQGLVPGATSAPDRRRLVSFTRPPGPFVSYEGREWTVPDGDVTEAVAALVDSEGAAAGPANPANGEAPGRHVLVCTHGRRDTCCGTLGTRLATSLPALDADVPVWRTSHTGGHRFAPTGVLLPEGTLWAYLDRARLVGIADRTLDVDEAARLYRGCTGLDGPEVQAADREALRAVGWSWLDHGRRGQVLEAADGQTRVRLDAEAPDGQRRAFEATVVVARLVPVPDCGKPPEEAPKSAPELRVSGFAAA
ncbi:MAG TPA: sucrase ferredoxin [Acidimicrobiales bacterium]|nr:sucrase ferredoxin [Acidimicrobiales bacterium]